MKPINKKIVSIQQAILPTMTANYSQISNTALAVTKAVSPLVEASIKELTPLIIKLAKKNKPFIIMEYGQIVSVFMIVQVIVGLEYIVLMDII